MIALRHEGLLREGKLVFARCSKQPHQLRQGTDYRFYSEHGIHEQLAEGTRAALLRLAERHAPTDDPTHNRTFIETVSRLAKAGRPRGWSFRFLDFLGLAELYGADFHSVEDLIHATEVIDTFIAGSTLGHGDKRTQREAYWGLTGKTFALLGDAASAEPPLEALEAGMRASTVEHFVRMLSVLKRRVDHRAIFRLIVLTEDAELDMKHMHALVVEHPNRVHDLIELIYKDVLNPRSLQALTEEPELVRALHVSCLVELLGLFNDDETLELLEVAQSFEEAFREMNETAKTDYVADEAPSETEPDIVAPEPEPEEEEVEEVQYFDHTQLNIDAFIGRTAQHATEALQVILVFGVIQPSEQTSSLLNGSEIRDSELHEILKPHIERLKIKERTVTTALAYLTTLRVLTRRKKVKRVKFNRTVRGRPKAEGIVAAVLDLAQSRRRSASR